MTKHPNTGEHDWATDDARDRGRPDSVEDVFRRVAASLRIPLETLALEHDAGRDGIPAVSVTHETSAPLIHVGRAVLTLTQARTLARRISRTVAQQRARGRWSLLRALIWARLVDLAADTRYGFSRDATQRVRSRGGAR